MRSNKLLRNLETKHSNLKQEPHGFLKKMLANLKTEQKVLQHHSCVNEKSLNTSYLISLRIAERGKPHTIGETLVLLAMKDTDEVFFADKSTKDIESIPRYKNTATCRIDEMFY